jgi:penicillin-binding protein 1A
MRGPGKGGAAGAAGGRSRSTKSASRKPKRRAGGRGRTPRRRIGLWRSLKWGATGLAALLAVFALTIGYFALGLPDVSSMAEAQRKQSVSLLAADGSLLVSYGDLYGEAIQVRDLPPALPLAVLAVEDRRYFEHSGVDPRGLLRAVLANLRAGGIVQGGSTITQQLAKNLFLTHERTLKRKIQELMLALWLERKFDKYQILTLYLNRVYLGAGAYGVDAAARRYFGKSATEVNLYEAAVIAGLLKAPSRYSPARDADAADARARVVLDAMVEAGFIDAGAADKAYAEKERGLPAEPGSAARYFGDWVLSQLVSYVGPERRDLIVETTLDPRLQILAEQAIAKTLEDSGAERQAGQAALVTLDGEGAVRALVGGRDYQESQFNRATQALRQPGSAFKLFVYLTAFEQGYGPESGALDQPIEVAGWAPENYSREYRGRVSLREAFAKSYNSVAVALSEAVGRDKVIETARRLGITSDLPNEPSLALGTSEVTLIELTGAYAAVANGGESVWPFAVTRIRGTDGTLLYQRVDPGGERVISPMALARITEAMQAAVVEGTGRRAAIDRPAIGKTGTSQNFRDAWFIGATAELTTGVWFGNDDGSAMSKVTGGSLPATTWAAFMAEALESQPARALPGAEIAVAEAAELSLAPAEPSFELRAGTRGSSDGFVSRLLERLHRERPRGSASAKSALERLGTPQETGPLR